MAMQRVAGRTWFNSLLKAGDFNYAYILS